MHARTFREPLGIAVHLQGIQCTDLQLNVIVKKLLQHRLEREQELLLFLQLVLTGRCMLLFIIVRVALVSNVLQETGGPEDQHTLKHLTENHKNTVADGMCLLHQCRLSHYKYCPLLYLVMRMLTKPLSV